jgi:spore germination protein KC
MKLAKAWLLLAALTVLTGCWNRVELNEIAIISATGVDWKEGQWVLSYQIVLPKTISGQTGGTGGAAINVFSSQGDNFRSAISKASQETSRRLYFSHNQIVIIGHEAARKGMGQLLEVYLRNHDSRETVSVFLSKGTARQLMEQLMPLEQIPGEAIYRMIENEDKNNSSFRHMTINNTLMELLSSTKATSLPVLSLAGYGAGTEDVRSLGRTTTPSKIRLSELGLVVGDKLVAWANDEESSGINWLNDTVNRTTVGFACSDKRGAKRDSSIRIVNAKTERTPVFLNGQWRMNVNIRASGTLLEYNCKGDIGKPDKLEAVERMIEDEIVATAMDGWKAISENKADVVGFGNLIHKKHPKLWKREADRWGERFPEIEVVVKARVNVSTAGSSGNNFKQVQEDANK